MTPTVPPQSKSGDYTGDRMLTADGMRFRVLSSVPPDGSASVRSAPQFVLVHGIGTSHRYLARLHAELASASVVHSVDLPGFGGLPKPTHSPTVEQMASSLGRALDQAGIGSSVLVGHSMGSQWVVELAVQRPDLASAVIAMGPVADEKHRSLAGQGARLAADITFEPPLVNATVFADYLRCGTRWFLRQATSMVAYPIEKQIELVSVPLMILRGGNDPIAGTAWCRRLRDACGGRLVVIPGQRHVVQQSAPRAVASAIRAFLGTSS